MTFYDDRHYGGSELGFQAGTLGPDEQAVHDPVKKLWQTVVILAVKDALGYGLPARRSTLRERARAWIIDGDDFEDVCSMADFDPHWIRKHVREFIATGQESKCARKYANTCPGTRLGEQQQAQAVGNEEEAIDKANANGECRSYQGNGEEARDKASANGEQQQPQAVANAKGECSSYQGKHKGTPDRPSLTLPMYTNTYMHNANNL